MAVITGRGVSREMSHLVRVWSGRVVVMIKPSHWPLSYVLVVVQVEVGAKLETLIFTRKRWGKGEKSTKSRLSTSKMTNSTINPATTVIGRQLSLAYL